MQELIDLCAAAIKGDRRSRIAVGALLGITLGYAGLLVVCGLLR